MRALHTQHAVALHLLEVARGISVSEEEYVFDRALLLAQQQRANALTSSGATCEDPLRAGNGDLEYYITLHHTIERFEAEILRLAPPPSRFVTLHDEKSKILPLMRYTQAFVELLRRPFARDEGLELLYCRKRLYARLLYCRKRLYARDLNRITTEAS